MDRITERYLYVICCSISITAVVSIHYPYTIPFSHYINNFVIYLIELISENYIFPKLPIAGDITGGKILKMTTFLFAMYIVFS